ncbi:MAG: hypothetical protein ACM3ZE_16270, partial [Myxococcales bacterium]
PSEKEVPDGLHASRARGDAETCAEPFAAALEAPTNRSGVDLREQAAQITSRARTVPWTVVRARALQASMLTRLLYHCPW